MVGAEQRTDGAQLLVVDDEALFSAFLKEKFEELGYSVAIVADDFEALEFVGSWTAPLVVLLDLIMPRVTGEGLLRELSRSPRAATIRVVLVSAPTIPSSAIPSSAPQPVIQWWPVGRRSRSTLAD
jgi:CheY-like chemotaxis protein